MQKHSESKGPLRTLTLDLIWRNEGNASNESPTLQRNAYK